LLLPDISTKKTTKPLLLVVLSTCAYSSAIVTDV